MRARTVWLGLGTNLGDRAVNLSRAIIALDDVVHVEALSGVYETDPFGYTEQPVFWNMALRGSTDLPAVTLLGELQEIERQLGRTPTFRMGPRVIDIDILLYDDVLLETESLRIPHPALLERPFVLKPLAEIDPALRHTATGEVLADHGAGAGDAGVRRLGDAGELLTLRQGA